MMGKMVAIGVPWRSHRARLRLGGQTGWSLVLDWVYLFGLLTVFPYTLYKLLATEKYRDGLWQRLGQVPPRPETAPCLWLHGVSVGEVLAARQFVPELAHALPGWEIVISTTTLTGQRIARETFGKGHRIFYFPFDFTGSVASTFRRIRPDAIVLMELEVWPAFLEHAGRKGIPVYVANGRLTENSFRGYQRVRSFIRRILKTVRLVLVQNETYGDRFRSLGVPAELVRTLGNMKYDNLPAQPTAEAIEDLAREYGFESGEPVLLAGSTHEPEEQYLLTAYENLRRIEPALRLVLVPRHPERGADLAARIEKLGHPVIRRSQQRATPLPRSDHDTPPVVLIVDTIGELGRLFALARLVFVGGSLVDHGGQNILEPAGAGKPIVIGPSYTNFREEVERLLDASGIRIARDPEDLERQLAELLRDPDLGKEMGRKARAAVESLRGASAESARAIALSIARFSDPLFSSNILHSS